MTATEVNAAQYPVVLRPLPITRGGYFFGGVFMVLLGAFLVWLAAGHLSGPYAVWLGLLIVVGVLFALDGLVVAVRGPMLAVIVSDDDVLVRGLFSSRRIQRSQVTGITAYPAIKWTDARGRPHSTLVNALNIYRRYDAVQSAIDNSDRGVQILDAWASGSNPAIDSSSFAAAGARTGRSVARLSASWRLAGAALGFGIGAIISRYPRYDVEPPVWLCLVWGFLGIAAAITTIAFHRRGSRVSVVIGLVGAGLAVVGITTALALGPAPLSAADQAKNKQDTVETGNGLATYLELLPSTPIATPTPSPGAAPIDTSPAATQERFSVNYKLVQIANKLILPHHIKDEWPTSVTVGADGQLDTSGGQSLGKIPAGYTFTYRTLFKRTDFQMTLKDPAGIGTTVDVGQGTSTAH